MMPARRTREPEPLTLHTVEISPGVDPEGLVRLAARKAVSFVLDSTAPDLPGGRYTFVGWDPEVLLEGRGERAFLARQGGRRGMARGDPFAALRGLLAPFRLEEPLPVPFAGGAVGYLGYDLCRLLEGLEPGRARRDAGGGLPDLAFGLYRRVFSVDRRGGAVLAHACLRRGEDPGAFRRWVRGVEGEVRGMDPARRAPGAPPPPSWTPIACARTSTARDTSPRWSGCAGTSARGMSSR